MQEAMSSCGNCSGEEKRLLHHVRHRGIFRRLCSSCVLRLNPQSLCPTCYVVYEHDHSPSDAVSCFKCYSSSHSHCVPPTASKPYICPLCTNPNSPIFTKPIIDTKASSVLLAAARISALSMTKAALAARSEAERRAKEAAFTRKRAREALEHVASLVAKDKFKTLAHHKPIAPLPPADADPNHIFRLNSHSNIGVGGGASAHKHADFLDDQVNKVTNGLLSVLPQLDQTQYIQHNQSTDDNIASNH